MLSKNVVYLDFPKFIDKGKPKCAETDPDIFFPDPEVPGSEERTRRAKRVCASCPYLDECKQWAIDNYEIGIWGGTTDSDRRGIRRGQRPNKAFLF